jgi:hypothetical protein
MKIHKDLLTHDGFALVKNKDDGTNKGKVLDLGFNGDFDVKKTDWNTFFVQVNGKSDINASATAKVVAYSVQSTISGIIGAGNKIAEFDIPSDVLKNGGVVGLPMPRNLKRYFTVDVVTANYDMPMSFTAGITDVVDTDTRFDWTNYKAATGTSEVRQRSQNVGEVIDGTVHAAITT